MRADTLPPEWRPERYIEKVSLASGEVLDDPIHPHQLLVHGHRDYHLVDVYARILMSRVVRATGREEEALRRMKRMRALGFRTSNRLARMVRQRNPERISMSLFGLKRKSYYFRYKRLQWSREEIASRLDALREEAHERLAEAGGLRILLTGGTGFVGKEILWQAAHDDAIEAVVVVVRPLPVRDRKSGAVVEVIPPEERGERLLRHLRLAGDSRSAKFRFVAGDVEQPDLGIAPEERQQLGGELTHVIHCAASVAFDDPYESSFSANVLGTLNALRFSQALQGAAGSRFVAHLGIETSYIHGRQVHQPAREDEIVFPRHFYNNYYELTKAMASIETERFMLEKGLRVVQLCPAIVIGESRAGNNRGDTKVVNAPINLFGRAHQARQRSHSGWIERSKVSMLARMALIFPGDPTAEINLIPVDRVVQGVLAALQRPLAIGERIHLATDRRVTSAKIRSIVRDETEADVRLADPTLHRTVTLPLLTKVLMRLKEPKLARILNKLGSIFGGYSEWGQPHHVVGNDVRLLGLSGERPDAEQAFRMLCRHNRYVQDYGRVTDPDELARREEIWEAFVVRLEERTGRPAGLIPAGEFREAVRRDLDLGKAKRS